MSKYDFTTDPAVVERARLLFSNIEKISLDLNEDERSGFDAVLFGLRRGSEQDKACAVLLSRMMYESGKVSNSN